MWNEDGALAYGPDSVGVTVHDMRVAEPTDDERQAVQRAVDQGDFARAMSLLEGIALRLSKARKAERKAQYGKKPKNKPAATAQIANPAAENTAKRKQPKQQPRPCTSCGSTFKPISARQRRCNVCVPFNGSSSVRTVSGGLPSLGKRR